MSSGQSLREFITKRLTAAAEEIVSEFEGTIVWYEEEIARQRRLLELSWNPQIHLHRIELPLHYIRKDEEVLTDQQLWNQERRSSLDQEEPEPPQIKVEQDEPEPLKILKQSELCLNQDEEQFVLKQEAVISEIGATASQGSTACPELLQHHVLNKKGVLTDQQLSNQMEPEPPLINEDQQELCIHLHEGPFILKQENVAFMVASPSEETDENQPLCQSPTEAENQDQDGCRNENSGSNGDEALTRNNHRDCEKPKRHSNERQFSCNICGRVFSRNNGLANHMRSHIYNKPQPCKICGKCFSLWKPYNKHMSTHNSRKEYPCEFCGKCFFVISKWTSHMRIHSQEKPRSCRFCGKRFFLNRNWTSHMRTHTREKPHSCEICGECFLSNRNLTSHMRTHTGETLYPCETCGKCFSHRTHLTEHVKTHCT